MVEADQYESLCMWANMYISGRNLAGMDIFSKSDPRCIVFEKVEGKWIKIGKTEEIKDNLNPDFTTAFTLKYYFEKE